MTFTRYAIVAAFATSAVLAVIELRSGPPPTNGNATPATQLGAGQHVDAGAASAGETAGTGAPADHALTPATEHDWDALDARLPALRERHLDDDVDADIDSEEAAALRRRAAVLREEIERVEGQERRGARALVETPEQMHKRLEDTERQISELDNHARQLEYEASELQSVTAGASADAGASGNSVEEPHPHHTIAPADPLAAGLDDDTDLDDDDDTDVD